MEVVRGTTNRRHKGDNVRGTIIIVHVVLVYFVSRSVMYQVVISLAKGVMRD